LAKFFLKPPADLGRCANLQGAQAEMREHMGSSDRSNLSKDELMAEFFLKPVSSSSAGTPWSSEISRDVDIRMRVCPDRKNGAHVTKSSARPRNSVHQLLDFSQRDPWGRAGRTRATSERLRIHSPDWAMDCERRRDRRSAELAIRVEQNGKLAMSAHTGDMILRSAEQSLLSA